MTSSSGAPTRRRRQAARRAHTLFRVLFDPLGWRIAGREEYDFVVRAISIVGGIRALRLTVASLGILMLPVAIITELLPSAPSTPALRVMHMVAAVLGTVIGALWLVGPMPTARQAIAFLVAADVLLAIGVIVLREPEQRMAGANLLAMLGLYAALLLGWRILLVHCLFALGLIAAMVWYAVAVDGREFFAMVPFAAPATIIVAGLPVVTQAVLELSRRGITRIARDSYADDLTGVLNRRGMDALVGRAMAKSDGEGLVYLSGAIDLDDFKTYNDTHGHPAGDILLVAVGNRLADTLPGVLVARIGGDEFALFAACAARADADRIVEALRGLVVPRGAAPGESVGDGIAASVGIAIAPARPRFHIDDIVGVADDALYEAKRSTRDSVVVRDLRTAGAR